MDGNDLTRWISDVIVSPILNGAFAIFGIPALIGIAYAAIFGRDAKPDKFVGPMFKVASGAARVGGGGGGKPRTSNSRRKSSGNGKSRRRN